MRPSKNGFFQSTSFLIFVRFKVQECLCIPVFVPLVPVDSQTSYSFHSLYPLFRQCSKLRSTVRNLKSQSCFRRLSMSKVLIRTLVKRRRHTQTLLHPDQISITTPRPSSWILLRKVGFSSPKTVSKSPYETSDQSNGKSTLINSIHDSLRVYKSKDSFSCTTTLKDRSILCPMNKGSLFFNRCRSVPLTY